MHSAIRKLGKDDSREKDSLMSDLELSWVPGSVSALIAFSIASLPNYKPCTLNSKPYMMSWGRQF